MSSKPYLKAVKAQSALDDCLQSLSHVLNFDVVDDDTISRAQKLAEKAIRLSTKSIDALCDLEWELVDGKDI